MIENERRAPARSAILRDALFLGLTAILVSYFLVWLPGPSAGLKIIGIEMGEWIKFLGVGSRRDLFYLPPIVAGTVLALLAATWPNGRRQTWLARVLAVIIALLAFPAIASIQSEATSEWLLRISLIGFVGLMAIFSVILSNRGIAYTWIWLMIATVALIGAVLPTLQYFAILPMAEAILNRTIGVGPGVWINFGGALAIALVATAKFVDALASNKKRQSPKGPLPTHRSV